MEKENETKKENIGGGGIVTVDPKPSKGIVSRMVDAVEKLIVWSMYDSSKPLHYLSGNFAPTVEETPPCKNLPIKGFLPDCLDGEFVRVGPNPKFAPVAGYHWFDGDGKSEVNVIDAKTMSADPVAIIELPNRVPYGFHALFVSEEQLQQQAKF